MSTYYVANENGDWWTIDTESTAGQTLFIIEAGELAKLTDTTDLDGLERHIRAHGTAQDIEVI
jgi:myo-inositol-hexaphosphate 3-phosphohydrolase